ncbi:hypothetical protein BRADI_2g49425v3 [Brachypodium distachyon]|uniref:Uncharacterized protein n=1 Tax=Brachypodium distachyon TaxID=15368 RepID=A0A0Q3KFA9_BRADI|nr:hypothetical protein BRADI_2g49425v3 [Brachypodium distachyon]PNT72823.1 hypothetical protein BRADI_2g49425v3 [Brachypodium distachyon]
MAFTGTVIPCLLTSGAVHQYIMHTSAAYTWNCEPIHLESGLVSFDTEDESALSSYNYTVSTHEPLVGRRRVYDYGMFT